MVPRRVVLFLFALPAMPLLAQQSTWTVLPNPSPPIAAARDSTREVTILIARDSTWRHWEWDGATVRERPGALAPIDDLLWLGDDPLRERVVGLALNPTRIATWDGAAHEGSESVPGTFSNGHGILSFKTTWVGFCCVSKEGKDAGRNETKHQGDSPSGAAA